MSQEMVNGDSKAYKKMLFYRQPQGYFVHRDFHSRNIMFKRGRVSVIDYQDARVGAITYDLVSLLKDVYVKLKRYE